MRIGVGQILILLILIILFFGKFPKVMKDLTDGLQSIRRVFTASVKGNHEKEETSKK